MGGVDRSRTKMAGNTAQGWWREQAALWVLGEQLERRKEKLKGVSEETVEVLMVLLSCR